MADEQNPEFSISCPLPSKGDDDRIVMAHGGGGKMSQRLHERVFLPAFRNPELEQRHDGAVFTIGGADLAFSTDSYVVRPLLFPGGTIGDLAVNGTVNDLAMCGAEPLYLSVGMILEEGLPMGTLETVVASMKAAAEASGVRIVTGDTKVVDAGRADGMYINTSGVGRIVRRVGPDQVRPGDAILVSGDLGRHGIAILSVREGLAFDDPVESDTAALWPAVRALFEAGIEVHCLRDLTRGGLSSALNEIAQARDVTMRIDEAAVPVGDLVRGACELLGLDPLYVANEGRFALFLPEDQASAALEILGGSAARIGVVHLRENAYVYLRSRIGGSRILDMVSGEQLPRIC